MFNLQEECISVSYPFRIIALNFGDVTTKWLFLVTGGKMLTYPWHSFALDATPF